MTDILKSVRNTSCGYEILIVDNAFDFYEMEHFYNFLESSLYTARTVASKALGDVPIKTMTSFYNEKDTINLGILQRPQIADVLPSLKNISAWANIGQPGTFITKHTDVQQSLESGKTLIYCANLSWEDHFGGDLVFCNRHGEKEIIVGFKPGRLMLFDARMPHLITPTCGIAPVRYSYVAGFAEDDNG